MWEIFDNFGEWEYLDEGVPPISLGGTRSAKMSKGGLSF